MAFVESRSGGEVDANGLFNNYDCVMVADIGWPSASESMLISLI